MALLNLIEPENIRSEAERTTIQPIGKEYAAQYVADSLSAIVAAGPEGEIGIGGDMIWHISDDLRRFRHITTGHTVIMGRKTWESLPKKPLPERRNIIVTRNPAYSAPGAECAGSLAAAIEMAKGSGETFIIGGGEIYSQAMPSVTRIYLTRILAEAPDADTYFPLPAEPEWMRVEQSERKVTSHGTPYLFETWLRMK